MSSFSETRRQIVHMAVGGFALLLRVLSWWEAALLAAIALLFNLFVLPRLGGRVLYRPTELATGLPTGIVLYPLAVLLLILALPRRPDIVAAAWGILAIGDGCATLVGQRVGGVRLPWNREKTLAGTVAFIVAGTMAGVFLAWWTAPAVDVPPSRLFVGAAPVVAAIAAALVESIPVRLNDNLAVPVTAASVLWALSLVSAESWSAGEPAVTGALPVAVVFNAAVAWLGYRAHTVSRSGAITGWAIGTVIYVCAGVAGWLVLFGAYAAAAGSSRVGLRRKVLLGISEEHEGRRGMGNALANCGFAAAAAVLAVATPYRDAALLAMVTALVAGGSDTVASELGKAWGRHTILVTSFTRVQAGTPGAISLEGTMAGFLAAVGLAIVGVAGGLVEASLVWLVAVAATIGSLAESALGATLEAPGLLNNDLLNFINTAVAATSAVVLARLIS